MALHFGSFDFDPKRTVIAYFHTLECSTMSALATLSSCRVCLRRWRDEDREAFAAMNSDARVMEFFQNRLGQADSDAMVDRITPSCEQRTP
jgi:RimJ/RimL family protein N-acetyltransferase